MRPANNLKSVLTGVEMDNLPKHLDKQTKEEVAQVADRMLKNKTTRDILLRAVVANPKAREAVAKKMLKKEKVPKRRDIQVTKAVAQATKELLKNKTARDVVAEEVATNPKTLEKVMCAALASGKLADFLGSLPPQEKAQIKKALG
jgi:hypothetical protein